MKSKSQESPAYFEAKDRKLTKSPSLAAAWPKISKTIETSPVSKSINSTNNSTMNKDFKRTPLPQNTPTSQSDISKKASGSVSDRFESANLSLIRGISEESSSKTINVRRCLNFEEESVFNDLAGLHEQINM